MYRVVSADTGVKITVGVYEKVALYVENKIVFVKIGAKIDPWQIRFVIGSNSAGCPATTVKPPPTGFYQVAYNPTTSEFIYYN